MPTAVYAVRTTRGPRPCRPRGPSTPSNLLVLALPVLLMLLQPQGPKHDPKTPSTPGRKGRPPRPKQGPSAPFKRARGRRLGEPASPTGRPQAHPRATRNRPRAQLDRAVDSNRTMALPKSPTPVRQVGSAGSSLDGSMARRAVHLDSSRVRSDFYGTDHGRGDWSVDMTNNAGSSGVRPADQRVEMHPDSKTLPTLPGTRWTLPSFARGYTYLRYGMDGWGPWVWIGTYYLRMGIVWRLPPCHVRFWCLESARRDTGYFDLSPRHARAADSPAALLDLAWQRPSGQGGEEPWRVSDAAAGLLGCRRASCDGLEGLGGGVAEAGGQTVCPMSITTHQPTHHPSSPCAISPCPQPTAAQRLRTTSYLRTADTATRYLPTHPTALKVRKSPLRRESDQGVPDAGPAPWAAPATAADAAATVPKTDGTFLTSTAIAPGLPSPSREESRTHVLQSRYPGYGKSKSTTTTTTSV
ncbi:hypothetical protein BKA56DRAFT_617848 [Ilyonectria sp. MPI-CAGE-AT-0026]|nr:hypothetical protein BKA56DRAFT_617848 [Ilyonectria sp. MPI-CAGE-AT-0026]